MLNSVELVTQKVTPERRFTRCRSFVTRAIADEVLIVPVSKQVANLGSIYTLNGVAGRIWNSLDGEKTVAQIIELVASEYEASSETVAEDTVNFLTELLEAGLIEPVR